MLPATPDPTPGSQRRHLCASQSRSLTQSLTPTHPTPTSHPLFLRGVQVTRVHRELHEISLTAGAMALYERVPNTAAAKEEWRQRASARAGGVGV